MQANTPTKLMEHEWFVEFTPTELSLAAYNPKMVGRHPLC